MGFEQIAYTGHAYRRMNLRCIGHLEVKRIINDPEVTHPSEDGLDRIVARGHLGDGRRAGVVYTEDHQRNADVLVITVIDFGAEK